MGGFLSKTFARRSTDDLEAVDLQEDAEKAGCRPISGHSERSIVSVHGVLRSVTLRPVDDVTVLEADLYDGSATVTLIWLGRRRIEGISAGRQLTAHGRLGMRGTDRVIYNPEYELGS